MTQCPPISVESLSGLRAQLNANGSLHRLDHGALMLNLFPGNAMEGGPANLHLRRRGARIESIPLLGPRSPARTGQDERGWRARGEWQGIRFCVSLGLARSAPAWFWHVELENRGAAAATLDLVHVQDLALGDYGFVRTNEYYVSHYVDYTPLEHPLHGFALAARQNLAMGGRHPWVVIGSLGRAVGFATDALELYGLAARAGEPPVALGAENLSGRRRQHEHSLAVLQEKAFELAPGARAARGFFGWFEATHEAASGHSDLAFVDAAMALPEAAPPESPPSDAPGSAPATPTLFSASPLLACRDLRGAELAKLFGEDLREVEREQGGRLESRPMRSEPQASEGGPLHGQGGRLESHGRVLSFFTGAQRHVVLRAKELTVLRPHGHLLRTGDQLVPDESSLTSTAWMGGVFHSLLTQGHVGTNRLLSAQRGYLGLFRSHGQRIFVELAGDWHLLDVPSAWEIEPSSCRWIYRHERIAIEVRSVAPLERHELLLSIAILEGPPCRFLLSHHVAVAGDDGAVAEPVRFVRDERGIAVRLPPGSELGRRFPEGCFVVAPESGTALERVGGDELLFADGRSRGQPFLTFVTAPATSVGFRITGHLQGGRLESPAPPGPDTRSDRLRAERFWSEMTGPLTLLPPDSSALAGDIARIQEILPWFVHDAWIHYLAPRGLEQFSGGGWGTRDVCQGPFEWLLALGRWKPLRDLLLRVFRAQNPDGDWPQWFMFFERERNIRPSESHGDIVFWPLLALARYLLAAEDASILDEVVPFFHEDGDERAEQETLWAHVLRALALIERRVVPGTRLAAYGNGDWNDSLQPADPTMREQLCSAWTVALHFETLTLLARGLRRVGREASAEECSAPAPAIRADFQRLLVADDVLAGFAYFHRDGRIERWMHPSDASTGIRASLLPMIQALASGLFTPDQAAAHVAMIREQLLAPDGARLFDRPPRYQGGLQSHFQRAETSAFFGREIGLMYTHAHLRYAEAIAHCGDGDAFFLALRQANPIGVRALIPAARPRQACCYTTSSDASFADRYEAAARYADVKAGTVALEGGWRVYSSGPGIFVRLVRECLLGLRQARSRLVIDPVLPRALDGLRARTVVAGMQLELEYRVGARGHGPTALWLDGRALAFASEQNPYRAGGAEVSLAALREGGAAGRRSLVVELR